jgi:hypothetical protein
MEQTLLAHIDLTLRYQKAPVAATRAFRDWEHNADILPRLQDQLEAIRDAYDKHDPLVYDTQGVRDDGSDLIVRYRPESAEGDLALIGFQVKSNRDIAKPDYLKELKAQHYDSFHKVAGLEHYFILLCVDGKTNKDKIRNAMAEFRSADRTTVIEPAYLLTFFHLAKTRIDALVTSYMEADDIVYREALSTLDFESPSARALAIFLAARFVVHNQFRFDVDALVSDAVLRLQYQAIREEQAGLLEAYQEAEETRSKKRKRDPDDWDEDEDLEPVQVAEFEDQLAQDLSELEGALMERDSGDLILRTEQLRPVSALMLDALVRYGYAEADLRSYMLSLLGR